MTRRVIVARVSAGSAAVVAVLALFGGLGTRGAGAAVEPVALHESAGVQEGAIPNEPVVPSDRPAFNEPAGFTALYDEPWDGFEKYRYWTRDNDPGNGRVEANGTLVWTYPPGFEGGWTAGSRVIRMDTPDHGPYQYHRDEGVVFSQGWVGHGSGVNKFRFWTRPDEEVHGYLMFEGARDGALRPAINTQGFPMPTAVWRWNDPENRARPSEADANLRRGLPHTVETLMYKGTPGRADGWVKMWLDGRLVLHFVDRRFTREGEEALFGPIHFAPYWGGVEGSLRATQTLSIDHSYVSWGSGLD